MKNKNQIIVTKKEVLQILGIKLLTLTLLEKFSKVSHIHNQRGYTKEELKRLQASLKSLRRLQTLK